MIRLAIIGAAAFLTASATQAQTISSTFDTGAENWVSGSLQSGLPGNNTVSYDAATRSIIATDPDTDYSGFLAPAKFLGNLSAFAGGTLSFQLADAGGNTLYEAPVALFGSAGTLYAFLPFAPSTDLANLSSYSISLIGASFYTGGPGAPGTVATDAQLAAVLANVTSLGIGLDFHSGDDTTRLDNVVLARGVAAVPEPASWALMIAGFGGVGFAMRRRSVRRGGTALA